MKILSLFDGMACGMIAMLNAGTQTAARKKWLDDLLGDCL